MQRWIGAPVLILLLAAISCLAAGGTSAYIEKDFTVAAGEVYTVAIEMKEGHSLEGDFSISGQQNYIDFYVKDALGDLAYGVVRAQDSHGFSLKARHSGIHTIYFDNKLSWGASRQVTLRYRLR